MANYPQGPGEDRGPDFDPEEYGLSQEEFDLIQSLGLDPEEDSLDYFNQQQPLQHAPIDVPMFSGKDQVDTSGFTEEDCDCILRLRILEQCPVCMSDSQVCPQKFDHLKELAFDRLYLLCKIIDKLGYCRMLMQAVAADTSDDMDIATVSLCGEIARIRKLIPKLIAAQIGLDSTQ